LARGQHRVLVADQHRGPIDGVDVARRVQERHPSVSVILLTGERTLPVAVEALQRGVFDFMTRSFDLTSLAEHLLDAVLRSFGDAEAGSERGVPRSMAIARDPLHEVLVGESSSISRAR